MNNDQTKPFQWPLRVYYEDTDAGGVVYHAGYLRFFERARTEWLDSLGCNLARLSRNEGIFVVVRSMNIDYLRPARLCDHLAVTVEPRRVRRASINLHQRILDSDDTVICRADVRLACVGGGEPKPRPIPESLLKKLAQWTT